MARVGGSRGREGMAATALLALLLARAAALPLADPSEECAYLRAPGPLSPAAVLERARAADRAAAAEAATRGAPAAGTRFLVAMRSIHVGSSWLTSMLRTHDSVGLAAREWWKVYRCCIAPAAGGAGAPPVRGGSKGLAAQNISACNGRAEEAAELWERSLSRWYALAEASAPPGSAVGFKNQLPIDLTRAPAGEAGPAAAERHARGCDALPRSELAAHELAWWQLMRRLRVRVVCLHRANALARQLSALSARKEARRNASARVEVELQGALADAALELRFKRLCERGGRVSPVFWLGYEDLYLGDREASFSRLLAFLDLRQQPPKRTARTKRAPRDIGSRVANAPALRARGGLLAQMLDAEFGTHNASRCPPQRAPVAGPQPAFTRQKLLDAGRPCCTELSFLGASARL